MGKKSRIVPVTAPIPIPKVKLNVLPILRARAEFGKPFNLKQRGSFLGPSVAGYQGVATWDVLNSDDQVLQFLEVSERLGKATKLYHGTPAQNITSITEQGLRPGKPHCMFGAGIYMGMPVKAMGYTRSGAGAHYLLEVEVALGKIKACPAADKHTLKRLTEEGYDSVGGFAGQTLSWGGTLRHNEYVVYTPEQVLVNRVHEYQLTAHFAPVIQNEGLCQLIIGKEVPLTAKNRAFKDVVSQQVCHNKSYTKVQTKSEKQYGGWNPTPTAIWICQSCIERDRLRVGSKVKIHHGYSKNLVTTILI